MAKKLDALVESFNSTLRDIESSNEQRIDTMRIRYDAVIVSIRSQADAEKSDLRRQRDEFQQELVDLIKNNARI